jgi:hypothetical protein
MGLAAGDDGGVGTAGLASNKGGLVLGFLSTHDEYLLEDTSLIWSKCRVLEGFANDLHWTTCMEIVGSNGIRSRATMFFYMFGFRGIDAKIRSMLPS